MAKAAAFPPRCYVAQDEALLEETLTNFQNETGIYAVLRRHGSDPSLPQQCRLLSTGEAAPAAIMFVVDCDNCPVRIPLRSPEMKRLLSQWAKYNVSVVFTCRNLTQVPQYIRDNVVGKQNTHVLNR